MKALVEAADRVREFRLHPLGFFYLLDGAGEGQARRVHLWLPGGRTLRTVGPDTHTQRPLAGEIAGEP